MIYLITGRRSEYDAEKLKAAGIEFAKGRDFTAWLNSYDGMVQFDTETNIVEGMYGWKGHLTGKNNKFVEDLDENGNRVPCKRECYVAQFGDYDATTQWLFDVPGLKSMQKEAMLNGFNCKNEKIIHNALFDYGVVKWCFGIDMNNLIDTFLMSKNVVNGLTVGEHLPPGYNGLAGCVKRYLNADISKEAQTSYTGEPMTIEQLEYAAMDVAVLGPVHTELQKEVEHWGLQNVVKLDTVYSRACGDAMCENLYLNVPPWRENMEHQKVLVIESKKALHLMMDKYFPEESRELGFIQGEDEYKFKWTSSKQKRLLLHRVYPDMPDTCTKVSDFKAYHKKLIADEDSTEDLRVLAWLADRDFESMQDYFISNHQDYLKEIGIYIPKDSYLINFNSSHQKLALFQLIDPTLESTGAAILDKISHPLASKLREYNRASKLASSYGQNFIDSMSPDGMFRIKGFQVVLNTGRSSMSMMQLLPGRKEYRNPFVPNHPDTGVRDDGYKWVMAGADYCSQEAVVAATFAEETSLMDAIAAGCDFHSTCASLMFPEEWVRLGGDAKPIGKPKDPTLLKLRGDSKAVSFGLFYGKSAIGLGDTLDIPANTTELIELYSEEYKEYMHSHHDEYMTYVAEYRSGRESAIALREYIKKEHKDGRFLGDIVTADDLIDRFYATFPKINSFLKNCAENALIDKFCRTPDPIGRVRRFPHPESTQDENAIKRQAQNSPIQGASANMTKYAICLIKKYLDDNNLSHKMKFALPLHDEAQYLVREDFAEEGLEILIFNMEKAAEYILGNTLLKAEGAITAVWEK